MQSNNGQLIRGLGLTAAISVNVANIIGTGVFLKARVMTCNVGTPGMALAVWLVAGLLSLAGALTYAELLAMMPRAAGEYGIMRDAYGRASGFIYGWTQYLWPLLVTNSSSMMTIVIGIKTLLGGGDSQTEWNLVMATTVLAMLPPIAVVVLMQRWFVKGLVESEK